MLHSVHSSSESSDEVEGVVFHSYQSTDQKVANYFGKRIEAGDDVWAAWFDAINRKALSYEYGSAVMHPTCDGDSYYSFAADPSASHTSLRLYYQY